MKQLKPYCFECQEYEEKPQHEWCKRYRGIRIEDIRNRINFFLKYYRNPCLLMEEHPDIAEEMKKKIGYVYDILKNPFSSLYSRTDMIEGYTKYIKWLFTYLFSFVEEEDNHDKQNNKN